MAREVDLSVISICNGESRSTSTYSGKQENADILDFSQEGRVLGESVVHMS